MDGDLQEDDYYLFWTDDVSQGLWRKGWELSLTLLWLSRCISHQPLNILDLRIEEEMLAALNKMLCCSSFVFNSDQSSYVL